jgi:hypothetical protein
MTVQTEDMENARVCCKTFRADTPGNPRHGEKALAAYFSARAARKQQVWYTDGF